MFIDSILYISGWINKISLLAVVGMTVAALFNVGKIITAEDESIVAQSKMRLRNTIVAGIIMISLSAIIMFVAVGFFKADWRTMMFLGDK